MKQCCIMTALSVLGTLLLVGIAAFFLMPIHPKELPAVIYQPAKKNAHAKRVLIVSTRGGGGNMSVARALTEYLEQDYAVATECVFSTILAPLDAIRVVTGHAHTDTELYDFALQKKWYTLATLYSHLGAWYFRLRRRAVAELCEAYFRENRPDLIISVAPLVNNTILSVAEALNIPFLLVPTDLDAATFLVDIKNPTYTKFHIALPFEEGLLMRAVNAARVSEEQKKITGFCVRKQFLISPKQRHILRAQTRRNLDIPEDKPTALLLMGALGSQEIPTFVRWLSQSTAPLHIIAAIGKSEHLRKKLDAALLPSHITLSVIGYTQNMAGLMAAADFIVTKSGTVSVCEALYMDLPMLLDGSSHILPWERLNHRFAETFGFGVSIKRLADIPQLVTNLLAFDGQKLAVYRNNMMEFQKKNPEEEMLKLIKAILQ